VLLTPVLLLPTVGGMHVSRKSINSVSTCKHFSLLLLGGMDSVYVKPILFIDKHCLARRCDTARQGEGGCIVY